MCAWGPCVRRAGCSSVALSSSPGEGRGREGIWRPVTPAGGEGGAESLKDTLHVNVMFCGIIIIIIMIRLICKAPLMKVISKAQLLIK